MRCVRDSCILWGDNLLERVNHCNRYCHTKEQCAFVEYLQMQVERYLKRFNDQLIKGSIRSGKIHKLYQTIQNTEREYPKMEPQSWQKNPTEHNPWAKKEKQKFTCDFRNTKTQYSPHYKDKYYKIITKLIAAGLISPTNKIPVWDGFDLTKWDKDKCMSGALSQFYGKNTLFKLTQFIKKNKMDQEITADWVFCQLERFKENEERLHDGEKKA